MSNLRIVDNDGAYIKMISKITTGEYSDEDYFRFSKDLAEAYGVSDHPKKGLLYVIAFDHGNKDGLIGILKEYDILVKLVR